MSLDAAAAGYSTTGTDAAAGSANGTVAPLYRCGTDLIRVSRVEKALLRRGERLAARVFTAGELSDCGWPERPRTDSLAVRFAAKEAVAKALGTGIAHGVRWTDIEVRRVRGDAPRVVLHGAAGRRYDALSGQSISISMSHEADLALAFCVIGCAR